MQILFYSVRLDICEIKKALVKMYSKTLMFSEIF